MKILLIPTTDWVRHPVPNRLNFIFDGLAEKHEVHVLNFLMGKFEGVIPRKTLCKMHDATAINVKDPSLYYILNSFYHLFLLRQIIRNEEIDVVVSANILPAFLVNFVKGDIPVVFDYLDHYEESASSYYPTSFFGRIVEIGVKWITRYNLRSAHSVITVTEEFENFLLSAGVKEVHVIPNGVDISVFDTIPADIAKRDLGLEGNVIGYVGSLEYWVDLETVVQALPDLDVTLLVIGPELFTDYGHMIRVLAKNYGVENKIVFTGRVEYSELYKYISAMDIGLNPLKHVKKNEITVGGKIFNYLACGKPILTSRMPALENLLADELFYYDDSQTFVQMVKKILVQKHDIKRYREIAETFDWMNITQRYEGILQNSIKE